MWSTKLPCIFWVLLNPSFADRDSDDPTMTRMIGFSYRSGFGSMIVMNLYPYITPQPTEMHRWRAKWDVKFYEGMGMRPWEVDKSPYSAFMHNIGLFNKAVTVEANNLGPGSMPPCVAAWGAGAEPGEVKYFLENTGIMVDTSEHDGFGIVRVPIEWKCLGTNYDGSPRHPLSRGKHRIPDDAQLLKWELKR
jgi:hypothetical protein